MGALGKKINPRKLFMWAIECEGLETAYAQKCKIPKIDVKSAKHGDGPFFINTASKVEFGQIEVEMLKPADSSAVWWKDWLALIVNLGTGAMGSPNLYKKTLFITEYAPDGETIIDQWECQGCYPSEIDPSDLDKLAEGNALDKVKLNVDRVITKSDGGSNTSLTGLLGQL